MANLYSVAINDLAVPVNATDTLANIKNLLEVPATSTQSIRLVSFDISFDGTTATAKPVLVQLARGTAGGTGATTGSNYTPVGVNVVETVESSDVVAANIKWGPFATTEGTIIGNGLYLWRLPPTSGFSYQFPLGREVVIPAGGFLKVRAVAAAAVNVDTTVVWEE